MNPCKAGLCARPDSYPWSSHRVYLGLPVPFSAQVETAMAFSLLGGRKGYSEFIAGPYKAGEKEADWSPPLKGAILGSKAFVDRVAAILRKEGKTPPRLTPQGPFLPDRLKFRISEALSKIHEDYGISQDEWKGRSRERRVVEARALAAFVTRALSGYRINELSEFSGTPARRIRKYLAMVESRADLCAKAHRLLK